ncbi:MAG: cytochrome c3 family protein [Bdellovibrionota bacterium]
MPVVANAQLGNFVNPGPLSNPHKSLDGLKNCTKCHSASQGLPDQKCLDCHTEINERMQAKKGYHARVQGDCVSCHSEHKGRDYDLTGLSRLQFDHTDTGWPLTGAHRQQDCKDCHKQKRPNSDRPTYLGNDSRCISCHTNIHKSQKGAFKTCQNCHGTRNWQPREKLNFNHNSQTKFKLDGAHIEVGCFDCHKNKTWTPLPHQECSNCHADPHNGSFGSKCSDCHSTSAGWANSGVKVPTGTAVKASGTSSSFDHDKTRFPLQGKHRAVSCKTCHGAKIGKMPTAKFADCDGCHTSPHKDQFQKIWKKKACQTCHSTYGYKNLNKFKHNRDARYQFRTAYQSCMQ